MKISWRLSELWTGQEKLMDRQTDRRMAGGHDIIRPIFDGHIKSVFILYFNGANSITSNLGVTLKGKNLLPGQILSFKSSPQWGGRWVQTISWESTSCPILNRINFPGDSLPQPFIFKFPDFSLTFQVLSKFPWPSTKFLYVNKLKPQVQTTLYAWASYSKFKTLDTVMFFL